MLNESGALPRLSPFNDPAAIAVRSGVSGLYFLHSFWCRFQSTSKAACHVLIHIVAIAGIELHIY